MSKKPLEDDLLTGGTLSEGKDKSAKKAEKAAAKAKKQKEKNDAKRASLKKEIDVLKEQKASETDSANIEKLDKKIKALSDKYASVGSNAGVSVAPRTAKIVRSVICIVIVVALLAAYVATGTVRKGIIASTSLPAQTLTGITVTNGEQKARIKVSTYNFYFATTYNSLRSQKDQYEQYGIDLDQAGLNVDFDKKLSKQTYTDKDSKETMTWAEHLEQLTLDSIESTYTYYLAAVEANGGEEPELTDDQKAEINETIESYRDAAEGYGYTLSGYLVRAMGKGVTEKVFRTETTRQYIADNYRSNLSTELAKTEYTADDVAKYKDEHISDLQAVDIMLFECDNEDTAKEFKSKLKADGSNFAQLSAEYSTTDFYKEANKDSSFVTELGVTRSTLISRQYAIAAADPHEHEEGEEHSENEELTYSGLDWLFSADRKAGDSYQYSTTVVYVLAPASIQDRNTVNVRHILVAPEVEEGTDVTEATAEQWAAAEKKAQSILKDWKAGDATEDSFAALVKDNSTDTGSADNGGLYENVITGQMVNPFSVWCFDNGRKAGDTGIVKTQFGYHIMYFVGENDEKVWEYNAKQTLASEDSTSLSDKLEKDYTLKTHWFASRYFQKDVDIDS